MPWMTVKPKISLNAEQELSQVDIAGATIRAKPNKSKVGETFAEEKRPDFLGSSSPKLPQEAE